MMKGKSIYFTKEELEFMFLTIANQDNFQSEEEATVHSNIYDKLSKATISL